MDQQLRRLFDSIVRMRLACHHIPLLREEGMTIVEAAVAVVAEGDTDLREEAIITITRTGQLVHLHVYSNTHAHE